MLNHTELADAAAALAAHLRDHGVGPGDRGGVRLHLPTDTAARRRGDRRCLATAVAVRPTVRLQMGKAEVEVRSEQDQRPERRRHNRRDDLGHGRQVGVVRVLRGDDDAEHHICEEGQIAHLVILRRAGRRSSPINVRVKRESAQPRTGLLTRRAWV